MSFDPICDDVARHFLEDEEPVIRAPRRQYEERVEALAQAIQDAIEAWLETHPVEAS